MASVSSLAWLVKDSDPWASSFGDLACSYLERCLGAYPEHWDADDVALEMLDDPNVWTYGSREDFTSVGGYEVAGAGVLLPASEVAFDHSVWGTAEEYGDARLERCRAFLPVPGVMQTLQAYWPCHLGIDNLNVARTIGRLLDHDSMVKPLPLVKDGALIALVQHMIRTRVGRRFGSLRSKGMLKMLMFSQVGFGWRIS